MLAYYGEVTQGGVLIAVSEDGTEWRRIIVPFKEYETRAYGWGEKRTVINPSRQLEEIFAKMDEDGIEFTRIRGMRPVGV